MLLRLLLYRFAHMNRANAELLCPDSTLRSTLLSQKNVPLFTGVGGTMMLLYGHCPTVCKLESRSAALSLSWRGCVRLLDLTVLISNRFQPGFRPFSGVVFNSAMQRRCALRLSHVASSPSQRSVETPKIAEKMVPVPAGF